MKRIIETLLKSTAIFLFAVLAIAPAARASITFDAQSSAGSTNTAPSVAPSVSWFHTVGSGADRMLVVGVTAESNPDVVVTSVTFGGIPLTNVPGSHAVSPNAAFDSSDVWYLANPPVGPAEIILTFDSLNPATVGATCGAVSLFGVKPVAPEAVATYGDSAGTTYSLDITTLTDGAWLVEVVCNGSGGATLAATSSQTVRWALPSNTPNSHSAACGTREVRLTEPLSAVTETWTSSASSRRALSIAAFAPVTPPPPAANMITFGIPGNSATITGTNIALEVLIGTDLTTLAPTYTTSFGATCPKASGSQQNFSLGPVHYILTSSDSLITKDYLVTVTAVPEKFVWAGGGSGPWDDISALWTGFYSGVPLVFSNGVDVIFNDAAGGTITVSPGMAPGSTTVSAASGTYTFDGGPISGPGSLTKSGSGTLTIGTATTGNTNTYTGKTIVQGGTLATTLGPNYLSNAGVPGVFGAPTGANATIDLYNGVTLQNNGSNPRLNQSTDRPLNLAGTGPGTVTIRVNDNDTSFTFGAVTATGTGAKTLALFTGNNNNGDRESLIFTGGIADSSDGSPTSLEVTFRTQTASSSWVSLSGVSTFTGPITLTQGANAPTGYLVIGGVRAAQSGANTVGTGKLGNGNYPGAISLGTATILEYDSTAAQILSGPISGVGVLTKTGSGTLTLAGTNTYRGNTTVSAGTLVLETNGVSTFYIADASNNRITGAGTATLKGTFSIDTSAVTAKTGNWTLVDTTTKSFAATFGLTGFTGPVGGVFTKVDGFNTWTFNTATGVLTLVAPALITSFGIPGSASLIDNNTYTIQLYVPSGTDFATLAPTFTVTSGTCNQTSGSPPSPTFAAANPAHYIVTAAGAVTNNYAVTAIIAPLPLSGLKVWLKADAINPADLAQVDASGNVLKWNDASGNGNNALKGTSQIAPKYVASTLNGQPVLRFTQTDDNTGSRLYLGDLSAQFPSQASIYAVGTLGTPTTPTDLQYSLFGNISNNDERWVGGNYSEVTPGPFRSGRASFAGTYPLMPHDSSHLFSYESSSSAFNFLLDGTLIGTTTGSYGSGSGVNWQVGDNACNNGAQLNGDIPEMVIYNRVLSPGEAAQVGAYLTAKYGLTTAYPGPAQIVTFGVPRSTAVIDNVGKTVQLTVLYGTSLATLAPTNVLSTTTATIVPASGVAPTPSFAVANPATYTVTDGATINQYSVTVTVAPPSPANILSNVVFAGLGRAFPNDNTGTNLVLLVTNGTPVTSLAPTYNVSEFASGSPLSGTALDFTTPQTYTVTAQDGSKAYYAVRVIPMTGYVGYEANVLASGPVSYWPLNEFSGTTALDIAGGRNGTYVGTTYTLGNPGLRVGVGTAVQFIPNSQVTVPFSASLNPTNFTVEFWTVPGDLASAYLVSLQDRSGSPAANRLAYAFQKNNPNPGFNFTYGTAPNGNANLNSTLPVVVGSVFYLAATYDGTTMSLYVNGALDKSAAATYQPATPTQPGFTIGARNGNTYANALIQDVAVYNRALSAQEILTHYQNPPVMRADQSGGKVQLMWFPGGGTLEAAPNVTGTYTNVPAATWPYTITPSAGRTFWRVQQ